MPGGVLLLLDGRGTDGDGDDDRPIDGDPCACSCRCRICLSWLRSVERMVSFMTLVSQQYSCAWCGAFQMRLVFAGAVGR